MTFRGRMKNGVVVLEENPKLADGVEVRVEVIQDLPLPTDFPRPTLTERFKNVIGKAEGLPPDASVNLDHYLYGHPKNE